MSSRKNMPKNSLSAGRITFMAEVPRATGLDFTEDALVMRLEDGRSLSVPLAWLPRLKNASEKQRHAYELLDGGEEIRWEALDEDLSVAGLLGLPD
jgi:hypothetical protein